MIKGLGTDIIEIRRILKASLKKSFMQKYFTEEELKLFETKNVETIAGNFACKEAVVKSFGTGFRNFMPKDIEVLRDELGKPYVVLHNDAKTFFNKSDFKSLHVSISHCKEYATAVAILE